MNAQSTTHDAIWKALADETRREILDALAERPLTTGEIVERFPAICRTNVMKHLEILVTANLVLIRRAGRRRWNYVNPIPIQQVCNRWINRHVQHLASAALRLREHVEELEANAQIRQQIHLQATRGQKK